MSNCKQEAGGGFKLARQQFSDQSKQTTFIICGLDFFAAYFQYLLFTCLPTRLLFITYFLFQPQLVFFWENWAWQNIFHQPFDNAAWNLRILDVVQMCHETERTFERANSNVNRKNIKCRAMRGCFCFCRNVCIHTTYFHLMDLSLGRLIIHEDCMFRDLNFTTG